MPDDVAIRVTSVSKDFQLPHEKVDSIKSVFVNPFRSRTGVEVQHALKDISFEIKKGEFFGIVGRNGSGKSTLLKIIAGIYQPTSGSVGIDGRMVPFIELGVGFNPELTGRENVYLNGAMLGFSKKQIAAMYEDIVSFAELEEFMDQKLKNYSSGMQVRLAFSVATRAKAEVLIIDEVLAVGDAAFQRKCFNYFKQLKETDTTIVFVTHDMSAVEAFCTRAIMIRDGNIVVNGTPNEVANEYTRENFKVEKESKGADDFETGLSKRVPYFRVISKNNPRIRSGKDVSFDITYEITDDTPVSVKFSIRDAARGVDILHNWAKEISGKGKHTLTYIFPTDDLNSMELIITAVLDEAETGDRIAHTNDFNSARVILDAGKHSNEAVISKKSTKSGHWVDWEAI